MHFVILGCGRVGARIATELDEAGHSVAIIDKRTGAFERLNEDFSGQRITGSGLHRSTLSRARITEAYGFASLTDGDNTNIIAARTARDHYQVPQVVARIYDPERAEFYERMGIPTVASVKRTSVAVMKRMLPASPSLIWEDPTGSVALVRVRPSPGWIGTPLTQVERNSGTRVVFVVRLGGTVLAEPRMLVQEHDELLLAQRGIDEAALKRLFKRPPGEVHA